MTAGLDNQNIAPPSLEVDDQVRLQRYDLLDMDEMLNLVHDNRDFWGRTLPWVKEAGAKTLQEIQAKSIDEIEQGVQAPYGIFVANALAGVVSLSSRKHGSAEMGFYLSRRLLRRRITSKAAGRLKDFGFDDWDLSNIDLFIRPNNEPSIATAKTLGARHIQNLWKEDEEGWMQRYGQWGISKYGK